MLEENQSCSLTFNAIERRFLFCSLPKPCAACHTGKVGNMELKSRSKRRSQMPMCPPDISTGTPWKKWVDSRYRNMDCKKDMCSVVWLDIGGMAVAFPFAISLVHMTNQSRNIKRSRKNDTSKVKKLTLFRHFICI